MFFSISAAIIIINFTSTVLSFYHMNEASLVQKHMMLHGKQSSIILVNYMISEYSKQTCLSEYKIKDCVETKKEL